MFQKMFYVSRGEKHAKGISAWLRKRGRQKKRWENKFNITEWTGLKMSDANRRAEDRLRRIARDNSPTINSAPMANAMG